MRGKGHRLPLPVRILIKLAAIALLIYAGLILFVAVQERSVLREVPDGDKYDAIIVLGAQVQPDGTPSIQLGWRLDAAAEAYRQKPVPVIVCGAKGKDEPMPEAETMKAYLMLHGVSKSDILTDPDSFNTRQNLQNAAKLLEAKPDVRKVLIVTSDYHVPRSLALARDLGFDAVGMGSPCKQEYWIKNHAREALAWVKYWGVKYLHLPLE